MPKIEKQKQLKRIPAKIYKYEKKSKFYYVRFWVCKGYNINGCHTQSLKVSEERQAEKEAIKVFKNFDFKSAIDKNKNKIKKVERSYYKDIALPYFKSRVGKNYLNITDKRMTRFNISIQEGVNFVLFSLKHMWGGELFVPKLQSFKITDLALAVAPKVKQKIIGIRPGEKIHEEMITVSDSIKTVEFKKYYVILPDKKFVNWNTQKYLNKNKSDIGKYVKEEFSYNSKNNPDKLSVNHLKKIIR